MIAEQERRRWVRPIVIGLGGGLLLLAGTTILWSFVLALNIRTFPSVPWFVVIDIGALYLAARYLKRRDASSDRLDFDSLTTQSLAFGVGGVAACYCLGVVEGAIAGIQIGPMVSVPGLSAFGSNVAVLFLPVYAAVSEELTFRGLVQCNLERIFKPHWAILVTSALFLAVHVQRPDFAAQWVFLVSLSIVLGIVAAKFRSLILCIILHAAANFIVVVLAWALGPFRLHELSVAATGLIAALAFVSAGVAVGVLRSTKASAA